MNSYLNSKCLMVFCAIGLFRCTSVDTSQNKPAPSLVRIVYQNPDIQPDLGVGLWAWPLPMDFDEDGDYDLVVSCPDVPFNGLYFFENISGNEKMPTFASPKKIGAGVNNIQVSFVEGKPKVMRPGVEYTNFTASVFDNPIELFPSDSLEHLHEKIRFNEWKYADYENDGDLDIIVGMDEWSDYGWDNAFDEAGNWSNGPLHGYVYLIENVDGRYELKGKIEANGKPIEVYGAPTPNMEDFDQDGDLDIICGEFVDRFTWFENVGSREKPVFAEGKFLENEEGIITMDLEMMIPVALDWDKDGDVDLVVGDEDGRVAFIENTGVIQNQMPVFKNPAYFFQEAQYVKFGALVTPYAVDWDEDGDEDLICGSSAGYLGFIENLDGGNPPKWDKPKLLTAEGEVIRIMAGENGSIQGPCERKWGYTTLSVADWDGDGLHDVIVNSIWGKVVWYKNTGTRGAPKLGQAQPVQVDWRQEVPKPEWNWWEPDAHELSTQWRTTPQAIDWNRDGLMDLVMLDHEGYLAYFERFEKEDKLWLKPGERIFYGTDGRGFDNQHRIQDSTAGVLQLNINKYGSSGRRKFTFVDWDNDGDLDLLVNSENVSLLENVGEEEGKIYFTNKGALVSEKLSGHTTSPTVVDWNKDGKPELLIGAEDGHFYYLKR